MRKKLLLLAALVSLAACQMPTAPPVEQMPIGRTVYQWVHGVLRGFTISLGRYGQPVCIDESTGQEVDMSYCQ